MNTYHLWAQQPPLLHEQNLLVPPSLPPEKPMVEPWSWSFRWHHELGLSLPNQKHHRQDWWSWIYYPSCTDTHSHLNSKHVKYAAENWTKSICQKLHIHRLPNFVSNSLFPCLFYICLSTEEFFPRIQASFHAYCSQQMNSSTLKLGHSSLSGGTVRGFWQPKKW